MGKGLELLQDTDPSATLRPGTRWGHGFGVALAVLGSQLDLREPEVFSSLTESVIF